MGAYDGAEICELVGNFMLFKLSLEYQKKCIGLYRDDGLAVFKNVSGPESEKIKKSFVKLFSDHGLNITIECNKKIVNYLDVTFNLSNSTHQPYTKPGNEINYIHTNSNHPPNIIKQLPISIETRLSKLSSNEHLFNDTSPIYEEALRRSGYSIKLKYQGPSSNNKSKNKRKRKIIWFNPPFSKNVKTKVGKYFLQLIDKHFPKTHKYHKLFNRNNVKISYSCMPNIKSLIHSHNRNIINPSTQQVKLCNCIKKEKCPLNEKCLLSNIVYKATVSSNIANYQEKVYIGLCQTSFKLRYANHLKSFNTPQYKHDTELSKEIWKIKEKHHNFNIKWEVLKQCYRSYNPKTKNCSLCLNEKTALATYCGNNLLNTRSEIIGKCRHKNKYLLE